MLYTTTRSDHDTYTAQRALKENRAPDGGLYIPMRVKTLSREEMEVLLNQSSAGIFAAFLNYFFSCKLSHKDVEFALGKQITRLERMSHRITVAECWRNPDGDYARIDRRIAKLAAVDKRETPVGQWLKVVSRISLLFCIYAQMRKEGSIDADEKLDVAVASGDFTGPMAAWYARKMGLPIGNLICCCNENSGIWDLLQRGEIRSDISAVPTAASNCGLACPDGLEWLIRECLGAAQTRQYVFAREEGELYLVPREIRNPFSGMYACVVGDRRILRVISNVHATNGYVLCPCSALVYAGLMDYRANTGYGGQALMICESSPVQCADTVSRALGISLSQLQEKLNII